jgi:hypothetical protein
VSTPRGQAGTEFSQGDFRKGEWSFYAGDSIIAAKSLVGRVVSIGTKDGLVFERSTVTAVDRGIMLLTGGESAAYGDHKLKPVTKVAVYIHDIARGFTCKEPGPE